jgi:hypothetical protein
MRHSISGGIGEAWQIRWVSCLLGFTLSVLFFGLPASAQLNLGRILGAVTDQTGGAVPGATVTVLDVARGVSRTLTTDAAGEYSASSLTPGMYSVRAEAKGFKIIDRQNILLEVGQDLRVDLTLQPGEQTQTVTVTESLPLVQTTNAEVSTTIENLQLNDLPLNGRLYTKLLDYTPGMAGRPGGNTPTYATNGTRSQAQDWMIDGVDDFNPFAGSGPLVGANTGNDEVTILPLDAIQEVNVVENPKAEFGWKQGAQVNVGLKSGTNAIHGSAYAFGRDTALDAQNPYLGTGFPRADDLYELFGASIGGPIKKDKLFYFANYEGLRFTIGSPTTIFMTYSGFTAGTTSTTDFTNSLVDAITDLQNHTVTPNQLSLNLAGCTAGATPACNASKGVFNNASTSSASIPFSGDNIGGSDNVIGKVDYHLNDKNSINGEYFFGNAKDNSASGPQPYWTIGTFNRVQFVRAVWVWTPNSNWVNEARFGYDRYNLVDAPAECTQNLGQPNYATAFGLVSGAGFPSPVCGFPTVQFGGANGPLTPLSASTSGSSSQIVYDDTKSVVDNVSYTRGKHLFKFGGEFHNTFYTGYGTPNNPLGTVNFPGGVAFSGSTQLEDFLAGSAGSGSGILLGSSKPQLNMNRYGAFLQDDWRILPRVIVNLGLRYEYEPAIRDQNNIIGNFTPSAGLVQQTNGQALYSVSTDEFSPRLGVAWDVTGKGTTVVRAGGSILYDTIPLDDMIGTQGANLGVIPTGFTLYTGSTAAQGPGTIKVGAVSLGTGQIPWDCNNTSTNCPGAPGTVTPLFSSGTSSLICANGLTQVTVLTVQTFPGPCSLAVKDPHFPNSYVTEWTVAIQHAFTNNLALNVAYVGNHGTHLPLMVDINQPTLGVKNSGSAPNAKSQAEQLRRPFTQNCPSTVQGGLGLNPNECYPYLGQINQYSPIASSNYNALQITLTQRAYHGLTLRGGYTYAHCMDQWGSDNNAFTENALNPQNDYANCDTTPFQHGFFNVTYLIPGIKAPAQLLEGWEVNSNVNLVGATPFNAVDTSSDISGIGTTLVRGTYWTLFGKASNFNNAGGAGPLPCYGVAGATGVAASRFAGTANCTPEPAPAGFAGPLTAANAATYVSNMPAACITAATNEPTNSQVPATDKNATGLLALANLGCYFENGSAIVPPAQGTFGNMRRNSLTDKPFREWDVSLTKNWKFKERLTAQFRAEFFNVLNSTQYSAPKGNPNSPSSFGESTSVPNSNNPFNGTGGPREIQLGLKLIF